MYRCEVCGASEWDFGGVMSMPVLSTETEVFPVAVMICRKCKFVLQFAWLGITRDQDV